MQNTDDTDNALSLFFLFTPANDINGQTTVSGAFPALEI